MLQFLSTKTNKQTKKINILFRHKNNKGFYLAILTLQASEVHTPAHVFY